MNSLVTINVKFIEIQSKCLVHFSHARMKVLHLVNSHVFIYTYEDHKIKDLIHISKVDVMWRVYQYGLHGPSTPAIYVFDNVVGKSRDICLFCNHVKKTIFQYIKISPTLLHV